ncbi:MAG TPA: AI-2E family transporter [Gemmatimonadaceae bacterium]|nr:AI-2E family transporter [Gemmatimonadaceae bacterium]
MSAVVSRRFRFATLLAATILTILLLWLFGAAADLFLLLFIAVLFSLYLGAVTDFFQQRLHAPRQVAFLLALALTAGAVVALFWALIPPVVEQTRQLIAVLPAYITEWEAALERAMARIPAFADVSREGAGEHRVFSAIYDRASEVVGDMVSRVPWVLHAAINFVAVLVMGVYLTLHPGLYREWLIALFPPIHRDLVRDVLGDLAISLRAWIVGQLLAMFILGALTAIGLWLLQVPFALTFGLFTGAVAIIPFFGTLVSTLLPALFVLGGSGIGGLGPVSHAWLVILLGVVIHVLESNVVAPIIMQRKIQLPPVLTMMAVLIFGKLLGLVGLLVAVPALAVVMVVVRRILVNRIYEGQGFRRTPRDRLLVLRVPSPHGGVLVPDEPPPDVISHAERRRHESSAA